MKSDESKKANGALKHKPFPWRCPRCLEKSVYPTTISYAAKKTHDGRFYEFEIPDLRVQKCNRCGEKVFAYQVDDQIRESLRNHLRLLTPEQIRMSRESLGLEQQHLAERLGASEEDILRWESGTLLQSRAADNLLRVFFAFPQVRSALSGMNQDPELGIAVES